MFDLLEHGSYAGIILVLVLTGAGLPIPEEVFVIGAGIASSHAKLNWALALPACLVGALLGDLMTYSIGRHFGRTLLRDHHWFIRYMTPAREREIEARIHQYGMRVFFLSRFMPGLRSPVYLTAGIVRYPFWKFVVVDSICAATVICTFFGLSFFFADRITQWWPVIQRAEVGLTVLVILAIIVAVGYFYWRHRRKVVQEPLWRVDARGVAEPDGTASVPLRDTEPAAAAGEAPLAGGKKHGDAIE
ncbi:MAG: DedA family protein [Planctomycetes bacterium]|nr:DedA family protein [Planctomycetota bacterium]